MGEEAAKGNDKIGRKDGSDVGKALLRCSAKASFGVLSLGKISSSKLEILPKEKKRNNIIDIHKAGGTRIVLFLQVLR